MLASLAIVAGTVSCWWPGCCARACLLAAAALPPDVVEVLGRVSLAPRQPAQLVRIGHKLILVSISTAGVKTLTEITDPLEVDRLAGLCQQAASAKLDGRLPAGVSAVRAAAGQRVSRTTSRVSRRLAEAADARGGCLVSQPTSADGRSSGSSQGQTDSAAAAVGARPTELLATVGMVLLLAGWVATRRTRRWRPRNRPIFPPALNCPSRWPAGRKPGPVPRG